MEDLSTFNLYYHSKHTRGLPELLGAWLESGDRPGKYIVKRDGDTRLGLSFDYVIGVRM